MKRKPQESTNEEAARDFSFCFGNIGEPPRKRLVTAMLDAGRDWDTRHSAQAALKQIDAAR